MAYTEIETSSDNPIRKTGQGLLDKASMTGLIRSGYGLLIALILVLVAGAYLAVSFLGNVLTAYADKTAQTVVLGDLAEDMFEARVAALTYRFEEEAKLITEVASNVDDVLNDPRIEETLGDTEIYPQVRDVVQTGMQAYLTAFEDVVEQGNIIRDVGQDFDELGSQARVALSDIRLIAYESGEVEPAYHAGVVQDNLMMGRYYATRFALLGNADYVPRIKSHFDQALQDIETLKGSLFNLVLRQDAAKAEEALTAMRALVPELVQAMQTRDEVTKTVLEAEGMVLQDNVNVALDELLAVQRGLGAQSMQMADRTTLMMIGAGLALAVLAALIAIYVAQIVTGRIRSLADSTDALVDGDLDVKVSGQTRKDETGRLARALILFRDNARDAREKAARDEQAKHDQEAVVSALSTGLARMSAGELDMRMNDPLAEDFESLRHDFNTAADRLSGAIAGIVDQTDSIQGGASNLSSAADELARRTEGQAAALEETAATIVQISESVSETATGADKANSFVATTRSEAESSLSVVASTVDAIKKIQATSAEVSQIIGVIDDIAFQTNLLALNAGVEAARAGDAGQGFAVVASEVRALAQRASNAAKEIKDLIETSVSQVDEGVIKADQTGEALSKIVGMVGEISDLVAAISSETRNQSDGLKEINAAVSQLDTVTQQNAAMVEETTAASHDLTRNSHELKRITGGFKTGGTGQFAGMTETAMDDAWPMAAAQSF